MKKTIFTMLLLVLGMSAWAKDIKTVVFTTTPQMHCQSCETKIKGNLRFEKGVTDIQTNIEEQKVTVTYNADKTTEAKIQKSFEKFGYKAEKVDKAAKVEVHEGDECKNM